MSRTQKADENVCGEQGKDEHQELTPTDGTPEGGINSTADVINDLISDPTIPAFMGRNIWKAFDRLVAALIDVPVGALERSSAEKWADTQSRIRFAEAVNAHDIQQIKADPEFAQRAANMVRNRVYRERFNLDKICSIAAAQLKNSRYRRLTNQNTNGKKQESISNDFLDNFEDKARNQSSEEMQERFARILAGEIERPGTFSKRSITVLNDMDSETASIFKTFCSGCISLDNPLGSGFVFSSIFPKFKVGEHLSVLEKYGLTVDMLSRLCELSLLRDDSTVRSLTSEYVQSVESSVIDGSKKRQVVTPFLFGGKYYLLKSCGDDYDRNLDIPGFYLSSTGAELLSIVEPDPIDQLTKDLKEYFANKQLELVEVELLDDGQVELK